MSKKSFAALYAKLEPTAAYQASALAVNFLADVHARMQALGMTQAELARKVGVSPAYITKLFRGSANLSVETMTKFSDAVDCKLHLHLANANHKVRWFDVVAQRQTHSPADAVAATNFMHTMKNLTPTVASGDVAQLTNQDDFYAAPDLLAA